MDKFKPNDRVFVSYQLTFKNFARTILGTATVIGYTSEGTALVKPDDPMPGTKPWFMPLRVYAFFGTGLYVSESELELI